MLRAAGAEVLVDNRELSVVGISEVLGHARVIYAAWRKIMDYLEKERPSLVVLIDFPDFNFLLARAAKRLGIRIFYYISPQVWAWRTGRVRTLKRLVHTMAVILPFEGAFYEAHGMKVHYVGHPLMDVLGGAPGREEAALRYRAAGTSGAASGAGPLVGLLPGSRRGEVRTMLPILMESAALMHRQNPSLSFLLALAPSLDSAVASGVARDSKLPIRVVSNDTYGVMRACDLLVAVSGTVTLEAAILGAPMVVVYKVSALTAEFGRWLIKVKYAAMPNLIADREIAPELIQARATPERIAGTALGLLNDPGALERQRLELSRVRQWLGRPGVADRVAELVLDAMP
jgi:lipid-A-disaccharide synthase